MLVIWEHIQILKVLKTSLTSLIQNINLEGVKGPRSEEVNRQIQKYFLQE